MGLLLMVDPDDQRTYDSNHVPILLTLNTMKDAILIILCVRWALNLSGDIIKLVGIKVPL